MCTEHLPKTSNAHILAHFTRNVYFYLLATPYSIRFSYALRITARPLSRNAKSNETLESDYILLAFQQ